MSQMNSVRYTSVAIALHWLIAFLIIAQVAGGLYMHNLETSAFKFSLYQWHKTIGLLILVLSFVRLGWRLTHPAPALPAGMTGWEKFAAKTTHVGFYLLMIATPMAGWVMVSASRANIPTRLFDTDLTWPHLPFFAELDRGLKKTISDAASETHELLAFATIGLLILHIAAALKHHFLNRDDVLTRMLPFLKPRV